MRIANLLCALSALSIAAEHAQAQDVTVSGRMSATPSSLVRNHYVQVYAVDSRPDKPLRSVQLASKEFDAWLIAVAPDGTAYFDDQSGGENDARLRIPARTGAWLIVATAYDPRQPGAFTLTVDGPRPVPTSRRLPAAAIERLPGGKGVAADLAHPRVDTVMVTKVDTVRVMRVDTVTVTRVDTVTRSRPGGPVRGTVPR